MTTATEGLAADQRWQLPAVCCGLATALPAVLARSTAEAALLAAHPQITEQQRLRWALRCLHRAQQQAGVRLPAPLAERILFEGLAAE